MASALHSSPSGLPHPSPLSPPSPLPPCSRGQASFLRRRAHDPEATIGGVHTGLSGCAPAAARPTPHALGAGRPRCARALLGGRPALGEAEAAGLHRLRRRSRGASSFHPVICARGRGCWPRPWPDPSLCPHCRKPCSGLGSLCRGWPSLCPHPNPPGTATCAFSRILASPADPAPPPRGHTLHHAFSAAPLFWS